MRILLSSRLLYIIGALILIGAALFMLVSLLTNTKDAYISANVSRGDVALIVPISAIVESESTAHMTFPIADTVESVRAREGDSVKKGDILATLTQGSLIAERSDAYAGLEIEKAKRDELLSGPRDEALAVTESSVANTGTALKRITEEENEKVESARRTLLSSNLEALPEDTENTDAAPTISGTYTCEDTGTYTLELYQSNARSGSSYRLTGLEQMTDTAYTQSPAPLGTCGLRIQFVEGERYGNKVWNITIPNTRSSSYVTNLNAYELAKKERANKIQAGEEALDEALKQQLLTNATPRSEELRRANASVMQAEARIAAIDAKIKERTLTAPFNANVTVVDMVIGETATPSNTIELLGDTPFILTARIPEIDIAKISIGQTATVIFDANSKEPQTAHVSFISPIATMIDGVAYFEAKLELENTPTWIRSGLNADVDITINKEVNVLRIPKRFLTEKDGIYMVSVRNGNAVSEKPVTVLFLGNDGFAKIEGLNDGEQVVTK